VNNFGASENNFTKLGVQRELHPQNLRAH